MDRLGGKGGGEEEKNEETREGMQRKGRRYNLPPLAKIPAGAHAAGCKTERRFLLS